MRNYSQITREERCQIYALKSADHNQSEIARTIGRHKLTVSRELARNRGLGAIDPNRRIALLRSVGKKNNVPAQFHNLDMSRKTLASAMSGPVNTFLEISRGQVTAMSTGIPIQGLKIPLCDRFFIMAPFGHRRES